MLFKTFYLYKKKFFFCFDNEKSELSKRQRVDKMFSTALAPCFSLKVLPRSRHFAPMFIFVLHTFRYVRDLISFSLIYKLLTFYIPTNSFSEYVINFSRILCIRTLYQCFSNFLTPLTKKLIVKLLWPVEIFRLVLEKTK